MPKKGTKTLRQRREVDRKRQKRFRQKLIEIGGRPTQIYFTPEAICKLDKMKADTGINISQIVNKMVVEPSTENLQEKITGLAVTLNGVDLNTIADRASFINAVKLLASRLTRIKTEMNF
jgi:hypothetical protein